MLSIELRPSRPHRPNLGWNFAVLIVLGYLGYMANRGQIPDEIVFTTPVPVNLENLNGRRSDFIFPTPSPTQTPDPIQDPANRDCATIDSSRPANPDPNNRHATTIIEALLLDGMGEKGLDLPPYWYIPSPNLGRRVDDLEIFNVNPYYDGDKICVLKPSARRAIPTPESGLLNSRSTLASLQNEQFRRERRNGSNFARGGVVFRG